METLLEKNMDLRDVNHCTFEGVLTRMKKTLFAELLHFKVNLRHITERY